MSTEIQVISEREYEGVVIAIINRLLGKQLFARRPKQECFVECCISTDFPFCLTDSSKNCFIAIADTQLINNVGNVFNFLC